MSAPSVLRRVASTSAVILGAKILGVMLVYGTHLTLAWLYGPKLMGTFFIAANLVILLGTACTLGLDYGMLRYAALLKEEGRAEQVSRLTGRSAATIMFLSFLVAGAIYLGQSHLAYYFHAPNLPVMLPVFAIALPLFAMAYLLRETLRGLGAILWATLSQYLVQPGLLLVLIILFFYLRPRGLEFGPLLSLAFLGSVVLTLAVLFWRLKIGTADLPGKATEPGLWKELCRYSWPLLVVNLLQIAMTVADSIILALFRPPEEVAYYESAIKLALLVTLPLQAVNAVVPPLFVRFYERREIAQLEQLARSTARWMYYLALPICLLLILLASDLLAIFGPGFTSARWSLAFLAIGQLVGTSVGSVFYLLFMTGHQQFALKLRAFTVLVTLPLMCCLASFYGGTGIALARGLGVAVLNLVGAWLVWKAVSVRIFPKDILSVTAGALAAFGVAWAVRQYDQVFLAAAIFSLAYLAILAAAVWQREEWRLFSAVAAKEEKYV